MRFDDKNIGQKKQPRKLAGKIGDRKEKIPPVALSEPQAEPERASIRTLDKKDWLPLLDLCYTGVLYGVIFLLPLFFLPFTTEMLELNKQMLLVKGTFLLAVIGGVRMLLAEKGEIKLSSVYIGFALVLATWIAASVLSLYPYKSFMGIGGQEFMSVLTIGSLLLFAVLLAQSGRERIAPALGILAGSLGVASVIGIFQLFGWFLFPWNFTKAAGFTPLGTVEVWGVLSALALLLSIVLIGYLSLAVTRYKLQASIALAVSAGIQLITLIILDDWRLWAGVACGLVFLIGCLFAKLRTAKPLPWLILPSSVLVLSLAFTVIHLPRIVALPLSVQPAWNTSMLLAVETIKQSPLTGFGPGTFLESYTRFRSNDINGVNFLSLWSVRFDQSSAAFFTKIAALGLLGLSALLVLFVLLGVHIWRYLRSHPADATYLLFAGLSALCVASVLFSLLKPSALSLLFVEGLVVGLIVALLPKKIISFSSSNSNWFLILSSTLLSVLGVVILVVAVNSLQRYGADLAFADALAIDRTLAERSRNGEQLNMDDIEVLAGKIAVAVQKNPLVDTYQRTLSQALLYKVTTLMGQGGQDLGAIQAATENVLAAAKKAVSINPYDVRNYENLASSYHQISSFTGGADSFAIEAFKKARELDPQNPSIPLNLAKMHIDMAAIHTSRAASEKDPKQSPERALAQKDLTLAHDALKTALALKSDLPSASYYLAVVLAQQGNTQESQELLLAAANQNAALIGAQAADPGLFTLIATSFAALGEKSKALDTIKAGLSLQPENQQALWLYANLLAETDNKSDALAVLGKMLEKNPKNEQVIKRIQELQNPSSVAPSEVSPKSEAEEKSAQEAEEKN